MPAGQVGSDGASPSSGSTNNYLEACDYPHCETPCLRQCDRARLRGSSHPVLYSVQALLARKWEARMWMKRKCRRCECRDDYFVDGLCSLCIAELKVKGMPGRVPRYTVN